MKKVRLYLVACMVILLVNACTDNFEETNTDPLSLTADKVDASLIGLAFAQTQYNSVNGVHWRFQISQNLFADLFCQYFATTQPNFDSDRYTQVGRWADLAWSSFYGQAAPNIKFVEDFTRENDGFAVHNAISKVWKVFGYHRITDYWGPVPYSSFGNGEISVQYDQQEDIYASFFLELDSAVAVLKQGGNGFGNNDLIFGGDASKWLKFAGSLRLRLAMRLKYVEPGIARVQFDKAMSDGVMESNDDNAFVLTTSNSPNPINTITNWGEYRMSATMESILKGYDDPRTPLFFSPAADGDDPNDPDDFPYEGLRNGQSKIAISENQNLKHSDLGPGFLPAAIGENNPIVVLRAAESYFLRAEAALEGWGGDAQQLYEEGIRMSMKEWTSADDDAINAYINSTNTPAEPGDVNNTPALTDIPIAYLSGGPKEKQLEQILTQKWLGLYPDGWEAWTELRRTGYPLQYDRLNSDNPDVGVSDIMRRMAYVTGEFNTNLDAVEAAVASSEIGNQDKGNTKLWWDKK